MERELRQLLAEIALMATGMHRHQEANTITDCLEETSNSEEVVVMIRAMSLMNKGAYEEAHRLLEPLCTAYPDLISLAALAAAKAGLLSKLNVGWNWQLKAAKKAKLLRRASPKTLGILDESRP